MNIIEKTKEMLRDWYWIYEYKVKTTLQNIWLKHKYPDYEDNEYNCGSLKHIWGLVSWDDLTGRDANLYTMNDIEITYDRKEKRYMLGVETAFIFKDRKSECKYLKDNLAALESYLVSNGYSTEPKRGLFCKGVSTSLKAESIEELYVNYRIFVEGYCKVYESIET